MPLDLKAYMGTWYELARYQNFFQIMCASSTAHYQYVRKDIFSILNICFDAEKIPIYSMNGVGVVKDGIKIHFQSGQVGDYVVLYTDYNNVSYVSDGTSEYFWILVRSKTVTSQEFERIIEKAKQLGADVTRFVIDNNMIEE